MKAQRETANLLSTKKAAAFLGLSLSSFYTYCTRKGLQPTKVRRSRRWYSKESLEAWRAGHPAPAPRQERTLPYGYVTTSELWAEMHRLNAARERRPLCRQKIIDVLKAAGVSRLQADNAAGLALVRRTCPVRNYFDSAGVRCGISYRVPELITVQGTRAF